MILGVVGKPSVGKSTFFRASTLAEAEIANYPFTTIKPNAAVGYVKIDCVDTDFATQCNPREGYCVEHKRFVPVNLIDVAGLVPGAHEGKGMGNQFLDDLRQADVLIHVIDISGSVNEKGEPVDAGSYDPAQDILFLEEELDLWYLGIIEKGWDKFARMIQQTKGELHKLLAKQLSGLKVTEEMAEGTLHTLNLDPSKPLAYTPEDLKKIATRLRQLTKPMVIACNKIDVASGKANFERLKKEFPDRLLIACSAESELALREAAKHELISYIPGSNAFTITNESKLSEKQQAALGFVKTNILDVHGSTGVQQTLDAAVFDLLKYIAIFPGGVSGLGDKFGNILPDCFLLPSGSTPVDFAFKIHTDIGKKYVKGLNVKTKLPMAKDHVLEHRDVVEIKTSS